MFFINLLPEIKMEYLRIRRTRRLLMSAALIIIPSCIVLCSVLYLLSNNQLPKKIKMIEAETVEIINRTNALSIDQGVTINEIYATKKSLEALKELDGKFVDPERLIYGPTNYIASLISPELNDSVYDKINFDFREDTFSITGKTKDLLSSRELEATFLYAGFEPCTTENYEARPLTLPLRAKISTQASGGESEYSVTYGIAGRFNPDLFLSEIEKPPPLIIPRANVSADDLDSDCKKPLDFEAPFPSSEVPASPAADHNTPQPGGQ